jgi:hypothetical protein
MRQRLSCRWVLWTSITDFYVDWRCDSFANLDELQYMTDMIGI